MMAFGSGSEFGIREPGFTLAARRGIGATSFPVLIMGGLLAATAPVAEADSPAVVIIPQGQSRGTIRLVGAAESPARLAVQRLQAVCRSELKATIEMALVAPGEEPEGPVVAAQGPFAGPWASRLKQAGVPLEADGRLAGLGVSARQGFVAARLTGKNRPVLLLASDTAVGLRNAILTLCDRLYRDDARNVVADPFDGRHEPAFEGRHIKTDALYCGPFNMPLEYWDPSTTEGVHAFADWVASFRITDYELLSFARGWGLTYPSQRFPRLVNPKHPNAKLDFYPALIDRLHAWGLKVWASDLYIASGYSMETGTVPEMLSPAADASKIKPYVAGTGTFADVLYAPQTIPCLSHPAAAKYYADVVDDLLTRYPGLDGLDFHIGHMFSDSAHKICRCPKCRDLAGNREAVYRCFRSAYAAAVARKPDLRIKAPVRMFGDATRRIEERHAEFPRLEFFTWLRWVGDVVKSQVDAPVLIGHEDGGGGLEGFRFNDPKQTMTDIRAFHRGWEPVVRTYISVARSAGLREISWEPALQQELEPVYFAYGQLTWEPTLSWAELARRYVIRSERRLDPGLTRAYQLALESGASVTHWGLIGYGPGYAAFDRQAVLQTDPATGLLAERNLLADRADFRDHLEALRVQLRSMGLLDRPPVHPPVKSDLRWSLVKTLAFYGSADTKATH